MILARLYSIRSQAWVLLTALMVVAVVSAIGSSTQLIPTRLHLYVVQPVMGLMIWGLAWYYTQGQKDRVRHRGDKAFLVGSVLAVWFVVYFLAGLITTYNHNSLVTGPKSLVLNIWSFGMVAFAVEYARHSLMMLVSRRNMVWFGLVLALVIAVQQMNFGLIPHTVGLDGYIKLAISNFVPAILGSFLLTYMAITSGLPAMLTYRLGLLAIGIFPPIIPKFDWYLQGVSLIILVVCVYIALDRTRQDKQPSHHHYRRHPQRAYDIMSVVVMACLVMFMTGVFSYKPSAIVSNSMKPVFSRGAIVVVQKIDDPMDVRVGDIVQYQRKDIMVTHRVVEIDASTDGSGKRVFITKGDNSPSKDAPVAETQIVGIVRSRVPLIGYPTVWLKEISSGKKAAP